jgi:hypothetical protein
LYELIWPSVTTLVKPRILRGRSNTLLFKVPMRVPPAILTSSHKAFREAKKKRLVQSFFTTSHLIILMSFCRTSTSKLSRKTITLLTYHCPRILKRMHRIL